eukprot:Skav206196  [mRNA]  locus=scaffold1844:328177:329872:+ [translate_table: standard]
MIRDQHGVFPLCTPAPVLGQNRPPIFQGICDFSAAFDQDGFNGKRHPWKKFQRQTVWHVADVRKHVQLTSNEMATKLTHDVEVSLPCELMAESSNLVQLQSWPNHLDSFV